VEQEFDPVCFSTHDFFMELFCLKINYDEAIYSMTAILWVLSILAQSLVSQQSHDRGH
jgi:hypothetical protein